MGRIFNWITNRIIAVMIFFSSICQRVTYANYKKKYGLHNTFRFNGNNIELYGPGKIFLGENSYLGGYSWIQSIQGVEVIIGRNCSLSHFVHIYTSNHYANKDFSNDDRLKSGNVVIGDYCWIGIKTTIIGPVVIGENAVVGANSLVNKSLPPHSISVGVPARVIKFKSYLTEEEKYKYALQYKEVLSEALIFHYKL